MLLQAGGYLELEYVQMIPSDHDKEYAREQRERRRRQAQVLVGQEDEDEDETTGVRSAHSHSLVQRPAFTAHPNVRPFAACLRSPSWCEAARCTSSRGRWAGCSWASSSSRTPTWTRWGVRGSMSGNVTEPHDQSRGLGRGGRRT